MPGHHPGPSVGQLIFLERLSSSCSWQLLGAHEASHPWTMLWGDFLTDAGGQGLETGGAGHGGRWAVHRGSYASLDQ